MTILDYFRLFALALFLKRSWATLQSLDEALTPTTWLKEIDSLYV